MKLKNKLILLIYFCTVIPVAIFFIATSSKLVIRIINYIEYGVFIFCMEDIMFTLKMSLIGIPVGIIYSFIYYKKLSEWQ
jgi:hypothetical protein